MDKSFKDESYKRINKNTRVHIFLYGRVQGVAFRYYAKIMADKFIVKGWIKNLPNGEVEIMIEGNKERVTRMIEWCKKGPSMAFVEDINIDWLPYTGQFNRFSIL